MDHVYWKESDKNCPSRLLDVNGEVVLAQCKICNRAESELTEPCEVSDEQFNTKLLMLLSFVEDKWAITNGPERRKNLEAFINRKLDQYADILKLPRKSIFMAMEANRTYAVVNYYNENHFPDLAKVHVFPDRDAWKEAVGTNGYRCPHCKGVSTDPTDCNSGVKDKDGRVCDWKSYGLFGTLGAGLSCVLLENFLDAPPVHQIFMPIKMEGATNAP